MKVTELREANGLVALLGDGGDQPLVSLQFWVQAGSNHEGEFLGAGLSHLLEHMVFKGTRSWSGEQLASRVSSLGAMWNAYTSNDRTVYHIDGPAEHWEAYLELLNELVFHPTFPHEEWEREREVIRREMAMYADDPQDVSYHALLEELFHMHPRRLPVIGLLERFDALREEDMKRYHQQHYRAPRVFVTCVAGQGCIDPEDWKRAVAKISQDMPSGAEPMPPLPAEPRQWGARLARREFSQPATKLLLAWRTPHANHPDAPAIALLASILGDGRAALLHSRFHDELGLAHEVSSMLLPSREGEGQGALVIDCDCEREDRDALAAGVREYLSEHFLSLSDDASQRALTRCLRQGKVQRLASQSRVSEAAGQLGSSWQHFGHTRAIEEWQQALEAQSVDDIRRVARSLFRAEGQVELSVDPLGSNACEAAEDCSTSPQLQRMTLRNGLRVLLLHDASKPLVHCCLALGAGVPSESREYSGINRLMAELLLKGTQQLDARELAERLEDAGSNLECSAGNNSLTLSGRALPDEAFGLMELLTDICLHPRFDAHALEAERAALLSELEEAMEDPLSLAFRRAREEAYGEHPYAGLPVGRVDSLQCLTAEDIRAQHSRLFSAKNAVLVLMGDVEGRFTSESLESLWAELPEGDPLPPPASPTLRQAELASYLPQRQQAALVMATEGLAVGDPDFAAAFLIEEWLRDMAGPLFSEIREKRGLAYEVSVTSFLGRGTGLFYSYLSCEPAQLRAARETLDTTLRDIAQRGMSEAEWAQARATAVTSQMLLQQSRGELAAVLAVDALLGLDPEENLRLPERLSATTRDEVNALLRRLLAEGKARSYAYVLPRAD